MLIDFSSCFALFLVLDEIGVASTNEDEEASPVALAIGYSITAAGFVFFFGPTTVVSLYSRAADKYTSGPNELYSQYVVQHSPLDYCIWSFCSLY